MSRKIANIRSKINIVGYADGYLELGDSSRVYLYSFEPSNLAVLSKENIRIKVNELTDIENTMGKIEFFALDDRVNFSKNRAFIESRLKEETNQSIRDLLYKDYQDIKQKEVDSRRFLIAYHATKMDLISIKSKLSAIQAAISDNMINMALLSKEEIQEIIAMYFRGDTTTPVDGFEDFDGENFFKDKDILKMSEDISRGINSKPVSDFDFTDLYSGNTQN